MPEIVAGKFAHALCLKAGRALIESVCRVCGQSQIVSADDGSLQRWEREHGCSQILPSPPLAD
jgi:hypothetical protein